MSGIREVWKYWPLKDGFRLISQKLYKMADFVEDRPKSFKLLADISFWGQPSKYCIAEFTAIFVCFLLSWSR